MVETAILAGSTVGLGLFFVIYGVLSPTAQGTSLKQRVAQLQSSRTTRRVLVGIAVGVTLLMLTGVIAISALAGAAIIVWPAVTSFTGQGNRQTTAALSAWAEWTERLRDTCANGVGLAQALQETTRIPPEELHTEFSNFNARLKVGEGVEQSLRWLADAINDPDADETIAALILSSRESGPQLGQVLTDLAESTRSLVEVRQTVEANQREERRNATITVFLIIGVIIASLLTGRGQAFTSPSGQIAALIAAASIGAGMLSMARLMQINTAQRFIHARDGGM